MNNTTKTTTRLAAIAGLALTVSSAHAAVIFGSGFSGDLPTEVNSPGDQDYAGDVITDDLLTGLTATVGAIPWSSGAGTSTTKLNNGEHGPTNLSNAGGAWTVVGASVEYNLGANELGYDITGIQSIASWSDSGFGNQAWTVEVKAVGGAYVPLATVAFTPFNLDNGNIHADAKGSTKVNLTGLNATGIESIKFTANSTGDTSVDNKFVWREIDVVGTAAVPEPSAAALLGLGGLALIFRRRK